MQKLIFSVFLCAAAAVPVFPGDDKAPRIEVGYLDEDPQELKKSAEARQRMQTKQYDAVFERFSLSDCLVILKDESGLSFDVNWPALELVGVEPDSLVEYDVKQASLGDHLNAVLAKVSADAFDDDKASYSIHKGVVKISTIHELNSYTTHRTYRIGQLLAEPYRPVGMLFSEDAFEDAVAFHAWRRGERKYPMTDAFMLNIYKQHIEKMRKEIEKLDPDDEVPAKKQFGGGGGLFAVDEHGSFQSEADQLIELIHTTIGDPDVWLDEESVINLRDDLLIIKTTPANHRDIEKLLNGLLEDQIRKQADILKDAHASQQVALANAKLKEGDLVGAKDHVRQALWIMPGHVPANAMKQLLEAMPAKPPALN